MSKTTKKYLVIFLISLLVFLLLLVGYLSTHTESTDAFSAAEPVSESTAVSDSSASGIDEVYDQEIKAFEALQLSDIEQSPATNSFVDDELEKQYASINQNPNYPTLESRIQDLNFYGAFGANQPSPEEVLALMQQESAWEQKNQPSEALKQTLNEESLNDGRQFVQIEPRRIQLLLPGDSLNVPIPQVDQPLAMTVDRIESSNPEAIAWIGTLKNQTQTSDVHITTSDDLLLATMLTQSGHYTLETTGNEGWVVLTSTLFKINPEVSDVVMPPQ